MKFKKPITVFIYLRQLLLLVGFIYAFSNCQGGKSILHFAGINDSAISQKSLTSLPVHGSCSVFLHQKNSIAKKSISVPENPIVPGLQNLCFLAKENIIFNSLQIHPAFEFNKSSISFPPIFIVFQNLKIAPLAVLYTA
jgi:hypothetical protein